MMIKSSKKGITLAEAAMGALITSIAAVFFVIGIKYINGLTKTSAQIELTQEAQVVLYQITGDIRDSDAVIDLNESMEQILGLQTYDYSNTYSVLVDTSLFSSSNVSTITYHYSPEEDCLIRTQTTNGVSEEARYLRGLLDIEPGEFIFRAGTNSAIDINLRLAKGLMSKTPKTYQASSAVRGKGKSLGP